MMKTREKIGWTMLIIPIALIYVHLISQVSPKIVMIAFGGIFYYIFAIALTSGKDFRELKWLKRFQKK